MDVASHKDGVGAGVRSLERLKALDSLSDLTSQLTEAKHLCNHAHRAEMIIKWLATKQIASQEARTSPEAWALLEQCLRLVHPSRIATLLGRFDPVSGAAYALRESEGSGLMSLMFAISKVSTTLHRISDNPEGHAIKRVLRVDSSKASMFQGTWMHSLLQCANDREMLPKFTIADVVMHKLLDVSIQIWELRKRTNAEVEDFCTQCFVPAADMLVELVQHSTPSTRTKLKRGVCGDADSLSLYRDFVEGLFARQIFLPARTAFFKAGDPILLRSLLEVFNGVGTDIDGQTLHGATALPLLLDIALRCVVTPTPRQRQKERPWVGAVFAALLDCMRSGESNINVNNDVLVEMLDVVGKRAMLPPETLRGFVQCYSGLGGGGSPHAVDWRLVAKIAELDATVFLDTSTVELLFNDLSAGAVLKVEENPGHSEDESNTGAELRAICREGGIVIPVMEAFAKNRDLVGFLDRWHDQLSSQTEQLRAKWTVWTELDDALADPVENYLMREQIERLVDRYHHDFEGVRDATIAMGSSAEAQDVEALPAYCRMQASIVLLNALLHGARNEELRDRLQFKLETCFLTLLKVFETGDWTILVTSHVWNLLTRLFDLWWPLWVNEQNDSSTVTKRANDLLKSPVFTCALRTSEAILRPQHPSESRKPDITAAERADYFIVSMCDKLQYYGEGKITCGRYAEKLVSLSNPKISPALLAFPAVTALLQSGTVQEMLSGAFEDAKSSVETNSPTDGLERLKAVARSAVERSDQHVIGHILGFAIPESNNSQLQTSNASQEVAIEVLSCFPAASLSRAQRERILNTLTDVQANMPTFRTELQMRSRLSLIRSLMELPNATSDLCTDAITLGRLGGGSDCKRSPISNNPALIGDPATLTLLEEIARLVMVQLVRTREQDRSRDLLASHAEQCQSAMRAWCNREFKTEQNLGTLSILKVVLSMMHVGVRKSAGHHAFGHVEALQPFLQTLLDEASNLTERRSSDATVSTSTSVTLGAILDAVLVISGVTSGNSETFVQDAVLPMQIVAKAVMNNASAFGASTSEASMTQERPTGIAPAVHAYRIFCGTHAKSNDSETRTQASEIMRMAEKLSDAGLQPHEQNIVVSAFANVVTTFASSEKALMLEQLKAQQDATPASAILLLKAAITTIRPDDAQSESSNSQSLLPHLVSLLERKHELSTHSRAVHCIVTILQHKNHLVNQYAVELTLAAVQSLTRVHGATAGIKYMDACRLLTALLTRQRFRLKGRFHLLITVLQALLGRLFQSGRLTPTQAKNRKQLTARHARAFARLLTFLCNPSQPRKGTGSELVDQARKDRAHVGQHVQYLLHHYCTQVLNGSLCEGMRDALTPGLWAMIEAIEVSSVDGIKPLSAAMNNSERSVLRSVYDEWKRFGKWQGG